MNVLWKYLIRKRCIHYRDTIKKTLLKLRTDETGKGLGANNEFMHKLISIARRVLAASPPPRQSEVQRPSASVAVLYASQYGTLELVTRPVHSDVIKSHCSSILMQATLHSFKHKTSLSYIKRTNKFLVI